MRFDDPNKDDGRCPDSSSGYQHWVPGQPDCYPYDGTCNRDECMWVWYDGLWDDTRCEYKKIGLYEVPVSSAPAITSQPITPSQGQPINCQNIIDGVEYEGECLHTDTCNARAGYRPVKWEVDAEEPNCRAYPCDVQCCIEIQTPHQKMCLASDPEDNTYGRMREGYCLYGFECVEGNMLVPTSACNTGFGSNCNIGCCIASYNLAIPSQGQPVDVVFAIDVSGSMCRKDLAGLTWLDKTKDAVNIFLDMMDTQSSSTSMAGYVGWEYLSNRFKIKLLTEDIPM